VLKRNGQGLFAHHPGELVEVRDVAEWAGDFEATALVWFEKVRRAMRRRR